MTDEKQEKDAEDLDEDIDNDQDQSNQHDEDSKETQDLKSASKERVIPRVIEDEMKESYLAYAMSVIVARALPDVRDGLKPVHRRILYAMWEDSILPNKPFKKSARIVGNVLGKYHPHGDMAVYDSMVRMAQDFSLRYTFIDGQGNWGSVDGDSAAAYRYCVTGDTLILTDKGITPIENISNKKETNVDLKILSYDGKKNKAAKFFNSGKQKIIKITTKSGYSLEGSYNHPILTWKMGFDFKPIISWKLLEDLKADDIVMINRRNGLFSKRPLNLKKYFPKIGFRNEVQLPSKMNNDLAFLLGALVSEGSFHNNQILFNNKDMTFYNKVKSIILSEFKGVQLYERKIKGDCKELSIYEQKVVLFLKYIGLKPLKAHEKEIPFSILLSTKASVKNFLIGLFEGDGSVILIKDKRHGGRSIQLTYDSKSKKLINQLKVILSNFGIITGYPLVDKRNNCLKICISTYRNIDIFYNNIGFFSKRKNNILKSIKKINSTRLSKLDFIPFLNDYLRFKYDSLFTIKNNFDRYNSLIKNYAKLSKTINREDKSLIDWLLKNEFYFDQITKIDKLKEKKEVYSIKVNSKCHSFIANGFINHNTEARLSKISTEMLVDIEKETVDFQPNFDGSLKEPLVLPSKLPNLLLNGSSGIAVGMATNIPPHNIIEACDGVIFAIDNPDCEITELMQFVKGPDFPTGGLIIGQTGIKEAYLTGRGKVILRAKTKLEEKNDRKRIIINEIPYQLNKSALIEEIADCVRDKRIIGISDIRDESDKQGMRVVIILKKEANPDVVLNQLYKKTRTQSSFSINFLSLVNNEPKTLNLKEMIIYFIEHRKEVVTRRTAFDLKKAELRSHILEGLIIALKDIDNIVKKIKASKDITEANNVLMKDYKLSDIQAKAILDMKLQKLASLEQEKIRAEQKSLIELIKELKSILADEKKILNIIKSELQELKEKYQDKRKTAITSSDEASIEVEDMIKEEAMIITVTHLGYIKRLPMDTYKSQKRGGKGVIAATTKDEDFISDLFIASTHSYLLFFTDKGQVHWLKVHEIPEASRQAKGKAIINLLNIENEKITAIVPVRDFKEGEYLIMATKQGTVKKVDLMMFKKPRQGGIRAITLEEKDYLINVVKTDGTKELLISTKNGIAIRFKENNLRSIGRGGKGVRGIYLKEDDEVIDMTVVDEIKDILTVTENGYGKRTKVDEYRIINRGGVGVINIKADDRNGKVVGVSAVNDDDEIMLISKNGITIRTAVKGISCIGRNTKGVRLMKLDEGDKLVAVAHIISEENGNGEE